jgi:hypothetical protein
MEILALTIIINILFLGLGKIFSNSVERRFIASQEMNIIDSFKELPLRNLDVINAKLMQIPNSTWCNLHVIDVH